MPTSAAPITLLIADDDAGMRGILRELLRPHEDLVVVAECGNGAEAVKLALKHRPSVIVMDLNMPVMDGLEAIEKVLQQDREARIVVLSGTDTDELIHYAFACGATGYVPKSEISQLVDAIRAATRGRYYYAA